MIIKIAQLKNMAIVGLNDYIGPTEC